MMSLSSLNIGVSKPLIPLTSKFRPLHSSLTFNKLSKKPSFVVGAKEKNNSRLDKDLVEEILVEEDEEEEELLFEDFEDGTTC